MKFLKTQLEYFFGESRLRRNLAALVRYFAFLFGAVALFTGLFQLIMHYVEGRHYSWSTGFYWTLTVMSTLGLGDITFESDLGRWFTSLVLLSGIVLLLVMLPFVFVSFFYAPWLGAHVRLEAPRKVPPNTRGHVIITHYDSVAAALVKKLELHNIPYFVVEADLNQAAILLDHGLSVISGRVDRRATYEALQADKARLVLANCTDEVNTNVALTVRSVSDQTPVMAIVNKECSVEVLELAGCNSVLTLKHRLGEQLANRVSARHSEAHVIGSVLDLKIAEFPTHSTPLAGKRIRELALREALGINIIAVWERGRFHPASPDLRLSPRSVIVAVGTDKQLEALNNFLVIYDTNYSPVVIIGGGVVGCAAAAALKKRAIPVHIVERAPGSEEKIRHIPDRVIIGDAADRRVAEEAGLQQTPTVMITTNDDDVNIYLTVYYRRLNPGLRIVSRITHEENIDAICRAGADFVLSSSSLGAEAVFSLLQQRKMVVLGEGIELFYLPLPPSLEGKTLAESNIAALTGLNVIAIQTDGRAFSNPPSSTRLEAGATLIVLGSATQRLAFSGRFGARRAKRFISSS